MGIRIDADMSRMESLRYTRQHERRGRNERLVAFPLVERTDELLLAAFNNQERVVQNLINERGAVDRKDQYRRTALHGAAYRGNTHIVGILVNARALVDARDDNGNTPLHLAAAQGQEANVTALLQFGAHKTTENVQHQTAHDLASNSSVKYTITAF